MKCSFNITPAWKGFFSHFADGKTKDSGTQRPQITNSLLREIENGRRRDGRRELITEFAR